MPSSTTSFCDKDIKNKHSYICFLSGSSSSTVFFLLPPVHIEVMIMCDMQSSERRTKKSTTTTTNPGIGSRKAIPRDDLFLPVSVYANQR